MDPTQKEHYLSFLDQQPHIRNFGRTLTIFPFTNFRRAYLAIDTLRQGLASTFEHSPHLAGTLSVPDATTGQLRLEYPRHIDVHHEAHRVFNDSFDVATDANFAYSALAVVHFDPSLFPAEVFCPKLLRNHPGLDAGDPYAMGRTSFVDGVALPVMAAQVTIIPGGLVISLWMHHSVSDGLGASKLYEMWSRDVRERRVGRLSTAIQEGDKEPEVGMDNKLEIARALDNLARTSTPEPQLTSQEQTTATLHKLPYDVSAALFRFNHSTIISLSVQLSSLTQTRISAFAALAALLWAHAIRARRIPPAFPTSTLAVVVDLRSRLGAPFTDPNYTENCVLCTKPACDIPSSLPTTGPLTAVDIAPLASIISTSLTGYTADVIKARLATLIKSTTSPPAIDCQDLGFVNGPDLYITDWRRLGVDNEWDIPGTGSSKPVAIRRACWKGEGGIVVLPRRKGEDADWEAMVSLEVGDLTSLRAGLKDGGWLVGESEVEVEVEVEPGRARL